MTAGKQPKSSSRKIAVGYSEAAQITGLSGSFLRAASNNSDPKRHLRTVRIARRRLIIVSDLEEWFARNAIDHDDRLIESGEPQAA